MKPISSTLKLHSTLKRDSRRDRRGLTSDYKRFPLPLTFISLLRISPWLTFSDSSTVYHKGKSNCQRKYNNAIANEYLLTNHDFGFTARFLDVGFPFLLLLSNRLPGLVSLSYENSITLGINFYILVFLIVFIRKLHQIHFVFLLIVLGY